MAKSAMEIANAIFEYFAAFNGLISFFFGFFLCLSLSSHIANDLHKSLKSFSMIATTVLLITKLIADNTQSENNMLSMS